MRMRYGFRPAWLLGVALLLSCASADQLAKRSEGELAAGQAERAYQTAVVALKHKPGNPAAIAALEHSGAVLEADAKRRIRALAESDTLIAARRALELAAFRREVARLGGALPQDPAFASDERAILEGAAAGMYSAADDAMHAGQPRTAWRRFVEARAFRPGFRDVEARVGEAYRLAEVRLAILPFEDETGLAGLGEAVRRHVVGEVERHLRPDQLTFTHVLSQGELDRSMTVSEQQHMTRERAIALGRRIGAARVVWGRLSGLHTDGNTDHYHETIFRRDEFRDSTGATAVRFAEIDFEAIRRERSVDVSVATEIIDVDDESAVTQQAQAFHAAARTVYTRYQPDGECGRYTLYPPEIKAHDAPRAARLEREWHDTFGSCALPALLERSKSDHDRIAWRSEYRDLFYADTFQQPVFMDAMPTDADLAVIALSELWRPVLEQVKEQDQK